MRRVSCTMATRGEHGGGNRGITPPPEQAGLTAEWLIIRAEREHAVTGYKTTNRRVCMIFERTTNDNTVYNVLCFDDQRPERDIFPDFALFPK